MGRGRRARSLRRSATPAARPAIPRACSTSIARPCSTPWPRSRPTVQPLGALGGAADRADVPRQCLGHPLGGADDRVQAGAVGRLSPGTDVRACSTTRRSRHSAGVPTVWLGHDRAYRAHRRRSGRPQDGDHRRIGRAARDDRVVPRPRHPGRPCLGNDRNVADRHDRRAAVQLGRDERRRADRYHRQARAASPFGVELRIVDDDGHELPRDGMTARAGSQVRGPVGHPALFQGRAGRGRRRPIGSTPATSPRIHPDGTMQITDRSKDVIKSGGEWISSIELENAAVGCPGRRRGGGDRHSASQMGRAAAAGLRPRRRAATSAHARSASISTSHVAKWWLPDAIEFVDELPHTATGKLSQDRRCASSSAITASPMPRDDGRPRLDAGHSSAHPLMRRQIPAISHKESRPHGRPIQLCDEGPDQDLPRRAQAGAQRHPPAILSRTPRSASSAPTAPASRR